ncbi:MAG: radical SAM protein [Clostridia bacterium]|nr:radical SAM protein [Clostridia bacterium]
MNKVMLLYPPGLLYQRSEDRAQCNISGSAAGSVHACNDLGYCAAVLLREGYEVILRDYQTARLTFDDAVSDIKSFRPDMIVLSTTNSSVFDDIEFLNGICSFNPCVCVMKGAVFFDISPEHLSGLDLKNVSCLIGCEMEFVICRIADFYLRSKGDLSGVNGTVYKKDGVFVKNPFVCGLNDLDSLPFPARELMDNSLYVRPDTGEMMATVQTGLGCPSGCIYCLTPVISGKNVRKRSVERVYEEIYECYTRFGIRNFFFKADTFTIDEAYACAICDRIISSPLHKKIEFTVNSRVKPLSSALVKKLKEAGCFTVAVGFESGSEETLKKIGKGTTVGDNRRASALIKEAGIPLFGFFMIGFPWETREHILETEKLIRDLSPDFIEVHIAMPFYGTGLYEECKKAGTLSGGAFGKDVYSPNTTGTAYLGSEELQKLKRRILLRFYLRPGYIIRKFVSSAKSPVVIKNYVYYGLKLVFRRGNSGRRV